MNNDRYVAAIEVSSSKIMAVVGKAGEDGHLDIIATEQERGVESVRYGIVQNLEETSMRISRIIERLQRKPGISPRQITGLYVGLSGRSLRSITTSVSLTLPQDTEITDEILERLRMQAIDTPIDASLTIVDAIPRIYKVDKYETTSPKGTIGNNITAVFDLVVCRPEMRRNLTRTITEKTGIEIKGFVVTALATGRIILTGDEKRQGCMLVDMGAETTTVSIYKNGHLVYFVTLPMGGRNITRDITSLCGLEEKAEDIKITSGHALPREIQSTLNMGGVRMSDVSNVIVARAEEIVANIVEQIDYAELSDSELPGGIVCIGGGAKLNGIIDLLSQKTGLPVRRGQLPSYITLTDSRAPMSEVIQAASILYSGAEGNKEHCLEIKSNDELPINGTPNLPDDSKEGTSEDIKPKKPHKSNIFTVLGDRISKIFGDDVDDSDLLDE